MEKRYGKTNRVWVMDRGMVYEDGLEILQSEEHRCIISMSKSGLRRFEQHLAQRRLENGSRRYRSQDLSIARFQEGSFFILCGSKDRAKKEQAMHQRFIKRMEIRVEKLQVACERANSAALSDFDVGRLLEGLTSFKKHYPAKLLPAASFIDNLIDPGGNWIWFPLHHVATR